MIVSSRASEIFSQRYDALMRRTDRLFAWLLLLQWLMGIVFAFTLSPRTWIGEISETHVHVYAATILGAVLVAYPAYLVITQPGATLNRMVIAVTQILFSVLFIHLTGGRIETHFHIFGSLAFLAIYRDWRVVCLATVVTLIDHLARGYFWPQSVYGVMTSTPWRAIEHAAWVVFEDIVLLYSIRLSLQELESISSTQAELECTVESVEERVELRTRELVESQRIINEQQQVLINSSKFSALGEMAGGVAHEINNPLATIKSLASQINEVLDDATLDRELLKKMSAKLEGTTDRIAKIVSGLRSFSRDGSKDPCQEVSVMRLIEDTLSFCQEKFKHDGTVVRVNEFDRALVIEARGTEISQVLLNLIVNAHDAIADSAEKWIGIEVSEKGETVEIRVVDSGPGISPENQKRLFQPFFSTKEIGKGTGLGLGISLRIMRNHGGTLSFDGSNKNTCFVMMLPKRQDKGVCL